MKLLVINLRGLQAGAVGPYGNRWTETFALDTLAANGVVFDQHFAVHPCPELARLSWETGCYHFHPGWPHAGSMPNLLSVLHHQDVDTRRVVDVSRGDVGFNSAWRRVENCDDSERAVRKARQLLEAPGDKWLLWLDLAALLPPWRVPEDIVRGYFSPAPAEDESADDEEEAPPQVPLEPLFDPPLGDIDPDDDDLYLRIRETYAAAVSHIDSLLAELLDGLPDDVHVMMTSDMGLPLGEHGMVGLVRPSLHEEVVHVPLIVYGPGCRVGRHVEVQTASVDLAPTIAALAGGKLEGAHGVSLVSLFDGEQKPVREHTVLGAKVGDMTAWALRTPSWALLSTGAQEEVARLYVKPDDPWEVNDVQKQHYELAESLEQTRKAFVEALLSYDRTV